MLSITTEIKPRPKRSSAISLVVTFRKPPGAIPGGFFYNRYSRPVVKKQRTPKNQLFETFVQTPNEIKK